MATAHTSASAMVEVALDPHTAFRVFTEEIGQWWQPGPINWNDSAHAVGIRIESGVGGRWLELHENTPDASIECGRITVWEPGQRFVFLYQDSGHEIDGTEVEIRFDAVADGTRVTLEHRGWERVDPAVAAARRNVKRWGWSNILNWYSQWAFWGSPLRLDAQNH